MRGQRRLRWARGVALLALVAGCGGTTPASQSPSPAPPNAATASLAMPSDLDVVVRIDLDPIRAVLPAGAEARLADLALAAATLSSSTEVVRHALSRARQVWIGWRPGPRPESWDNVIILRGDFASLREADLTRAFHPSRDLGAGWRAYDARQVPGRASPARLYAHLEDLWVVASTAELDAVDRILEGRAFERGLEPPEKGVLSMAARMGPVAAELRRQAPKASRFLSRARNAQASADLTSEGLDVSADLEFEQAEDAERAAGAFRLLLAALALQGPSWTSEVGVSHIATTLTLKARIPHQALARAAE